MRDDIEGTEGVAYSKDKDVIIFRARPHFLYKSILEWPAQSSSL